jgi:hypothetical protein
MALGLMAAAAVVLVAWDIDRTVFRSLLGVDPAATVPEPQDFCEGHFPQDPQGEYGQCLVLCHQKPQFWNHRMDRGLSRFHQMSAGGAEHQWH